MAWNGAQVFSAKPNFQILWNYIDFEISLKGGELATDFSFSVNLLDWAYFHCTSCCLKPEKEPN